MKNKIPMRCKIKNKLVHVDLLYRSPSASSSCAYGFRCNSIRGMNCPKRISMVGKYILEYLNEKDIPPTIKVEK